MAIHSDVRNVISRHQQADSGRAAITISIIGVIVDRTRLTSETTSVNRTDDWLF